MSNIMDHLFCRFVYRNYSQPGLFMNIITAVSQLDQFCKYTFLVCVTCIDLLKMCNIVYYQFGLLCVNLSCLTVGKTWSKDYCSIYALTLWICISSLHFFFVGYNWTQGPSCSKGSKGIQQINCYLVYCVVHQRFIQWIAFCNFWITVARKFRKLVKDLK